MINISISDAQKHTSPNWVSLICAKKPNGTTNLTTISWWTYLANHPAMIGFSMSKKSYTGELIRSTGKAILSVPNAKISKEVFECGHSTGRDIDKAEKFGIELTGTDIQYPLHSKFVFFCTLKNTVEAGDHVFHICEVDDILYNDSEPQVYAWDGYSKIAPLVLDPTNCTVEQAFSVFSKKAFGNNVDQRYVYDVQTQKQLISQLLLNGNQKIVIHFTYLPRIIGLRAVADQKEVIYQRGLLTFEMKDGMCHVTSKLEVSSQGVPTEYRGFAVITNPFSTGPACTCFLREINNAFGIFILFSFRLSSIEDVVKRKTRISECMAVRKDDGTSFVYRLILSENFINDQDMRYFEGYLKMGTNENTSSGRELNILIRKSYIDFAERYFTGTANSFAPNERKLYADLQRHFDGVQKSIFADLIKKLKTSNSFSNDLFTVNPADFDIKNKDHLLFLGWLRKYGLSARHDKVENVLDDNVEEVHKTIYPELHGIFYNETHETPCGCILKKEIITYLSAQLSDENVGRYSEKAQKILMRWGEKCNSCSKANSNCEVLKFYNGTDEERRKTLS